MRGAATATVISQLIGMVWVVSHFVKKDSTVHFEGNIWKMKRRIVESIFAIGMSPFLMNVCACAIVIIINNSLQNYGGDMAIGAYGIINRLLTLYVMIVLGLTTAVINANASDTGILIQIPSNPHQLGKSSKQGKR